jgi:integrase
MATQHLTDAIIKRLPAPERGIDRTYDGGVPGLGIYVTAAGVRGFFLRYRTSSGRERSITLGRFPDWSTVGARQEARRLRQEIDRGADPLAEVQAEREAPTMAELCDRFVREHVVKLRPRTRDLYRGIIDNDILGSGGWASRKVSDIAFEDVAALHARITARSPYMANRAMAVLSKMFALAIRWRLRPDNPVKGVERKQEHKRQRYLDTRDELPRLLNTLASWPEPQAANCVRMLLLTGARRNEVLAMRWGPDKGWHMDQAGQHHQAEARPPRATIRTGAAAGGYPAHGRELRIRVPRARRHQSPGKHQSRMEQGAQSRGPWGRPYS